MTRAALKLTTEERFLALVADASMQGGEEAQQLSRSVDALVSGPFDWARFFKLSRINHYEAAAARVLRDAGALERLPREIHETLDREYILSQARAIKKESELLDVLRAMRERDIEPMIVKGIPLAYLLYRDPGVRVTKDTDILVEPSEVDAAKQVLLEKGYSLYTGFGSEAGYRAHHFHYVFGRGQNFDSVIELHWGLTYPGDGSRVDGAAIRERSLAVKIGNTTVRTPSLPHAFWHLAMHASHERFLTFRSLVELKGIARRLDDHDWDDVLSWSSRCRTNREIVLAVNLAESIFGDFLDSRVAKRLAPGLGMKGFILSTYYPRALIWEWVPFGATHELVMKLYLKKGFARKLKFLYHLVFPDRATLFHLYLGQNSDSLRGRIRMHANGLYVLIKVGFLSLFMGPSIRGALLRGRLVDPERNKVLQPAR